MHPASMPIHTINRPVYPPSIISLSNISYLLENERRTELKINKLENILNELKLQEIELDFITGEGKIETRTVNIVNYFGLDNIEDDMTIQEGLKKFKEHIAMKFKNMNIDKEIEEEVKNELEFEGLTTKSSLYWREFIRKYKEKLSKKYDNLLNNKEFTMEDNVEKNIGFIKEKMGNFEQIDKLEKLYELYGFPQYFSIQLNIFI